MRYRKIFKPLMVEMMIILALLLSALLGVYLFTIHYSVRTIRQNTIELNETIMNQTRTRIKDYCQVLYNVTTSFCQSPSVLKYFSKDTMSRTEDLGDLEAAFSNTLLLEEHILSASLYDVQMSYIAHMGKSIEIPYTQRYMRTKMQIETSLVETQYAIEAEPYFEIFYPVYDLNSSSYQKALGLCVLVGELDAFEKLLEDSQVTTGTSVFLLDKDGQVMASKEGDLRWESFNQAQEEEYWIEKKAFSDQNWTLVSAIPERDFQLQNTGTERMPEVIFSAAVLLFFLFIFYYYRRVIQPLEQINGFIRSTAAYPEKRLSMKRTDEIGTVADSLDQMLDENQAMQTEIQISQQKMYETELARHQAELLAYRSQINPHFLYNTFSCICDMAICFDVEDIAKLTRALANVFRFAVSEGDMVTIAEEIKYIEEYAKIIYYRFQGKIHIRVAAEEKLQEKKIFKLLLQPLVENAVFHGLEKKREPGKVEARITAAECGKLRFVVEDDGCGMTKERLDQVMQDILNHRSGSVGISNIFQRLHLYYGDEFMFDIKSMPGEGTCITIEIPDLEERSKEETL